MNALLNIVEHFLKLLGLLLIMVFIAWSLVTLGLLADTGYLLHLGKPKSPRLKNAGPHLHYDKKTANEQLQKKAA